MNSFFTKNWWLFYFLLFLMIGWLVYAILWQPKCELIYQESNGGNDQVEQLQRELEDCINNENNQNKSSSKVNCNAEVKSGGQGETTTTHELGSQKGNVVILYDMDNVPDQMNVFYNNKLVASTKRLVSNEGSLSFNYNPGKGDPTFCIVELSAPQEGTLWEYLLKCPE